MITMIADDSNHSTITVERAASSAAGFPSKATPMPSSAGRTSRKRVRFNEANNVRYGEEQTVVEPIHLSESWDSDDDDDEQDVSTSSWYSSQEYQQFRDNIREELEVAREEQQALSHHDQSFHSTLRRLYFMTRRIDFVLENVQEVLKKNSLPERQVQQLYQSTDGGDNDDDQHLQWLGLERHLLFDVKRDIYSKREAIQDVVYEIQLEVDQGVWHDRSSTALEQEIQESCLNHTQSCNLFAQILALAQCHAS